MLRLKMWVSIYVLLFTTSICVPLTTGQNYGDTETVYKWVTLDYDWPSIEAREKALLDKKFIPANNIIAGVKWYKDEVYVTTPRWRPGVPATLNKVILKDEKPLLQPFPSWEMNAIDDCEQLQLIQGIEIDPISGWMWILDVGSRNIDEKHERINKCPPKLVIYDLEKKQIVRVFKFPKPVVSWERNFLNDIVVDRTVKDEFFAYISDAEGSAGVLGAIVVYNYKENTAHRITDPAMHHEPLATVITINGHNFTTKTPVDGIALRPDGEKLYFCALAGFDLYEVPTKNIRKTSPRELGIRKVGKKVSQTDGMVFGQRNLYFGALGLNSIYKWEYGKDTNGGRSKMAEMKTWSRVASDNEKMLWVDSLSFAQNGWLYFTTNRVHLFQKNQLDLTGNSGANFRIMRVYVQEKSYFYPPTSGYKQIAAMTGTMYVMFVMVTLCLCHI